MSLWAFGFGRRVSQDGGPHKSLRDPPSRALERDDDESNEDSSSGQRATNTSDLWHSPGPQGPKPDSSGVPRMYISIRMSIYTYIRIDMY